MKPMVAKLTALLCLLSLVANAEDFPGIESLMTPEELAESGVDTLSEAQLSALNSWLIRYTANDAPSVAKQSEAVKQEQEKDIESFIEGDFKGWKDNTEFKLANGQVWKQRRPSYYRYLTKNPAVIISKNALGFYTLTIVETGKSIAVTRIK